MKPARRAVNPLRAVIAAALIGGFIALPALADVPYEPQIRLQGLSDKALVSKLDTAAQLVTLKDRPPPTEAALRGRAQRDLGRLGDVLKASGYWAAKLRYRFDRTTKPITATIDIVPGPLFHFAAVAVTAPAGLPAALTGKLTPAALGLARGTPALSDAVKTAHDRILDVFTGNGYPFVAITEQKTVVDLGTDTMAVTFVVAPGALAHFGATTITGLRRVNADFVERRITWHQGAPYDSAAVERTRQALVGTGLFNAVSINHADRTDAAGALAMTVTATEGPPRSVGAGVGYNTNLGLGTRAFWQHRNLFGEGEQLNVAASVAQRQLGLSTDFRRPDFLLTGQDLLAGAEFFDQTTDAYHSRIGRLYTGLEERQFPPFTFGGALAVERAYINDSDLNENYMLFSVPLYVRRDTTDNLLDPTQGSRQALTITPYYGLSALSPDFVSSRIETRFYQAMNGNKNLVFAEYGALGSIVGASLARIPVTKRLYAGGAGSVRGFAYQRAGPLDSADRPTGGRSSLEFGGEFRYRFAESFGIVPFFDAGNVYPSSFPNGGKLFYSAGLGFRYYTAIGPVRLDFAFPIDRRPSDAALQFYISIGQAF